MSKKALRVMQLGAEHYGFHHHIVPLAIACRKAGFEVLCVCPSGPLDIKMSESDLRFIPIPFGRGGGEIGAHISCLGRLVRLLRSEQIDILHSHSALGGLLGRVAARLARVPVSLYTAHGFHFHEGMPWHSYAFFWAIERIAAKHGDFLFTQNEDDRRSALSGQFTRPDRVAAIGNGVNLARFSQEKFSRIHRASVAKDLGIPLGAPLVTFIGRATLSKGAPDFLKIACHVTERHPTVWFLAVMPLADREPGDVRVELESNLPPRSIIVGYRSDIPAILAITSVFVLPSQYEGLNKTIIEAMAMSLPVVGYDVRGIRELVRHGETGKLVARGDWEGASRAVLELLGDEQKAHAMGGRAREYALTEHDQSSVFARQIEVMRRIIAQKGAR